MRSERKLQTIWILALLAVLMSYSFDLECQVELKSCSQESVHLQSSTDCAQPGLLPSALSIAILPAKLALKLPTPRVALPLPNLGNRQTQALPPLWCLVPLGLRAPPLA